MLILGYKKGETFTLVHQDGTQMHGHIVKETEGNIRIAWYVPDSVKVSRDTVQAQRAREAVGA